MKWEERVGWALPVPPSASVVRVVLRGRARMGDNENSVTSLATELRREGWRHWRDGRRGRGRDRGSATRLGKQTLVSRGKTFGGGAGREGRGGRGGTCCYNMHVLRAPLPKYRYKLVQIIVALHMSARFHWPLSFGPCRLRLPTDW